MLIRDCIILIQLAMGILVQVIGSYTIHLVFWACDPICITFQLIVSLALLTFTILTCFALLVGYEPANDWEEYHGVFGQDGQDVQFIVSAFPL